MNKKENMSPKNRTPQLICLMLVILFLFTGCGGTPIQSTSTLIAPTYTPIPPSATPLPSTSTPVPATATPQPSPTLPPTPTAISASQDPLSVGSYKILITEVRISDSISNISNGAISNYKGALVLTQNGMVPKDATPGGKLLMVFIELQTGDYKGFLDSDLKINTGDSNQSTVAILSQEKENRVIWVFDVKPSSKSFLLVFADGTRIDLTTLASGQ
jgi:hypothetical protein